uniref:Uncharacterized protein n=1 Tax=Arundo donax TaxID=35708 RepID=A0A0A9BEW4_ARUDO
MLLYLSDFHSLLECFKNVKHIVHLFSSFYFSCVQIHHVVIMLYVSQQILIWVVIC